MNNCPRCKGKGYIKKEISIWLIVGRYFMTLIGLIKITGKIPRKVAEVKKCPVCSKNK